MAIITDSIIDVGNYITFNIGLSKSINNYTAEEVWNFPYCSSSWDAYRHICDESYQGIAPGSIEASEYQMPFHFTGVNQLYVPATYNFEEGQIEYNQGEKGIYGKIIWLCVTGDTSIAHIFGTKRTIENSDSVKIITQMDMTQVYLFLDSFRTPGDTVEPMYTNYDNFKIKENHEGVTSYEHPRNCSIFPAVMFMYNNKLYIHRIFQNSYTSLDWSWWLSYYGDSDHGGHTELQGHYFNAEPVCFDDNTKTAYLPINIMRQFSGLRPTNTERFYTASDIEDVGVRYQWMYGYDGGRITPATEAKYLQMVSWYGMMFNYNGTYYKPIIEDGYVTGYTDDMTVPSDIDNWTGATNHDVPPAPPGPAPGPYDDDPWSGATFAGTGVGGAGAFAKCYYMTSTELANLRTWMNSNNVPEGFDPMQQIIGLSQVPVSLSGDDNTTVQFVNSSAVYDPGVTRLVDSGVNTQISMGIPKRYSLGSVDIVRRMQERGEPYLDYDCQIELYLPLIGMFSLDTQAVMGRTITAEAVLDPISGTLAAYAYVSRDGQNLPIAYGSTTIGVDLPITAQQYSVARAALKQANAQLGTSLLSSTLSLIAAATAGGKGSGTGAKTATGSTNGLAAAGIREAGADYMKASQAGNVFGDFMQWGRTIRQLSYGNNTAIAGSFGGSSAQWSYPFTPYVKIIRPRYEKPSNYNHSQGVPCVQAKTVGSCTGFIQCIGVDVSGITGATDIELQAIQAALTNGVFAGGGS